MRFECSHCGKKYSSADEPTPGRVYVIGCKCGHSIVVKGPEKVHPRAAARASAPRPAAHVTPAPSQVPEPGGIDPFPEAGARRGRAGPSLDPFADLQDVAGQAGARPLADVPEIKGPIPEPTPQPRSFDPFAAQQGLLLEEDVARAIQGGATDPAQVVAVGDEVPLTFSEQLPVAEPARARERAAAPRRPPARSSRVAVGVFVAALALAAVAGGSWFYFLRPSASRPPAPAPVPLPPAPVAVPAPSPGPPAPKAATPAPVPAPPAVAVRPPPAEASPASAPPPPARAAPEREPPRRAAPSRAPKKAPAPEPVVAVAPATREPAPPPPAPKEPPQREPAAKPKAAPPAPDKSMLDPLGAKKDAPSASPPAAAGRPGEGLSPADVEAAVKKNRKAFDGCVEDAVRNEPGLQVLGRRVGLYLTVNPSGIVTAPRLDDPELIDTELGACLKSAARKMVFPQFQGDPFQVKVPLALGHGE